MIRTTKATAKICKASVLYFIFRNTVQYSWTSTYAHLYKMAPLSYGQFCLSQGHQLHTHIKISNRKKGRPREEDTREERGLLARASCNTGSIYNAQYRHQQKGAQLPSDRIINVYKIQLECRSILSNPSKMRLQGSYRCLDEKLKTFSKNNYFIFQSQFYQIYDR